jgi:serine/threonine protein kinase
MGDRLNEFEFKEKLGQGSFGVVFRVISKKDRQVYVMKQIDFSRMGRQQKQESLREALLMNKLNNEFIVHFYDSFQARSKLNIVMELCENKDLG